MSNDAMSQTQECWAGRHKASDGFAVVVAAAELLLLNA